MPKRTILLPSATGMLLTVFSSSVWADIQPTSGLDKPELALRSLAAVVYPIDNSPHATIDRERIQSLLVLSGIDAQLKKIPAAVAASLASMTAGSGRLPEPFGPADNETLSALVVSAFKPETLNHAITDRLLSSLDAVSVSELLAFYQSDLGQSFSQAEQRNSLLTNSEQYQAWLSGDAMESLSDYRQQLIAALERAMNAADGAVDAMIAMQVAMQTGLTPLLPDAMQLPATTLLEIAEQQREELRDHYYQTSLSSLAFVFRDESDESIRRYVKFLNTETGSTFTASVNLGITGGLYLCADQLSQNLLELLSYRTGRGA